MNKEIFCFFLKRKAKKQKFKIYPGKLGEYIYNNISQEAWEKWKIKQTIIINEKKLNMSCSHDRKIVEKEMINFLLRNNK